MRDAAQRFVGEHDFRNFCKVSWDVLTMLWFVDAAMATV